MYVSELGYLVNISGVLILSTYVFSTRKLIEQNSFDVSLDKAVLQSGGQ